MGDDEYPTPVAKRRRISRSNSSSQDELSHLPPPTRRRSSGQLKQSQQNTKSYDNSPDGEDELSHDSFAFKPRPTPLPASPALSTPTLRAHADVPSAPDSDYYTDPGASSPVLPLAPSPRPEPEPPRLKYKPKLILKGHKRAVTAVKFSPDGSMIASCSADATLRIHSLLTGKPLHTLHGHLAGISTLAWSPSSTTLASGSDDNQIRLWSINATSSSAYPHPHPLTGHANSILTLVFSPKGNVLASGSADESVILWDVRTRRIMRILPAHGDPVNGVDFSRDGTLVASCAADGLVRIWDAWSGQCLRTFFHEETPAVGGVKFAPNGRYVATWMLDGCVRLWDYVGKAGAGEGAASGRARCVKTYLGHRNGRFSLVGGFGTYLVGGSGGDDGKRRRSSGRRVDGEAQKPAQDGDTEMHDDVDDEEDENDAHSPIPKPPPQVRAFITSGSEDGAILLWDVITKSVLQRIEGALPSSSTNKPTSDTHENPAHQPDEKAPSSKDDQKTSSQKRKSTHAHTSAVFGVDVHPDPGTRLIASCGEDGTVRVWGEGVR